MITRNTVLILGAGASVPYGFPTGEQLMQKILDLDARTNLSKGKAHNGEHKDFTDYIRNEYDFRNIRHFFQDLRQSGKYSVDAFIEHRPEFTELGKALIAYEIIKCEKIRSLNPKNGHWYMYLYNKINDSFDDIPKNNLSIITFNYDRSFEQCMLNFIQSDYGKTFEQAEQALNSIRVIHLHGKLGELSESDQNNFKPYKTEFSISDLHTCIRNIKIIHEEVPKNDEQFKRAIEILSNAEVIWFLGFGFHKANLQRLKIPKILKGKEVFFTTYGKEKGEIKELYKTFENSSLIASFEDNQFEILSYLRTYSNVLN